MFDKGMVATLKKSFTYRVLCDSFVILLIILLYIFYLASYILNRRIFYIVQMFYFPRLGLFLEKECFKSSPITVCVMFISRPETQGARRYQCTYLRWPWHSQITVSEVCWKDSTSGSVYYWSRSISCWFDSLCETQPSYKGVDFGGWSTSTGWSGCLPYWWVWQGTHIVLLPTVLVIHIQAKREGKWNTELLMTWKAYNLCTCTSEKFM